MKKTDDLIPYENNPRINDDAVEYVAESIREFGFKVPIVIDKDNVVVTGHTRLKASKELGLKEVPCIIADDLSEEQVRAYRLADNKVGEIARWDYTLLDAEIEDIEMDMEVFGFDSFEPIDWANVEELDEETYEKPKKDMLKCPNCGHIDSKINFFKATGGKE